MLRNTDERSRQALRDSDYNDLWRGTGIDHDIEFLLQDSSNEEEEHEILFMVRLTEESKKLVICGLLLECLHLQIFYAMVLYTGYQIDGSLVRGAFIFVIVANVFIDERGE